MRGMKLLSALRMEYKIKDFGKGSKGSDESGPNRHSPSLQYGETREAPPSALQRFVDSFKPDPNAGITPPTTDAESGHVYDVDMASARTAASPLHRKLKGRHLQMIAIGGSIGTGLFVGSGSTLASGGPAAVLIAYAIIGVMLYCTMHALGEMAVLFPVAGSFSAYSTRFIDPAWGFAMGWNYAMQWLVTLPLEIIAATITIQFWNPNISNDSFVIVFLAAIIFINFFGVVGYGEAEFVFSIIKVVAVIGFILLGIVLVVGGNADSGYIGGRYWSNPGAFNNGFKGLCSCFIVAAFAFAGTELAGLAAAETENPRKTLPTAIKQVFWRITLFYIVSLTLVGLLVPYTNPALLNATGPDTKYSPFVIAINSAGIAVLPSVFNAVILIAVISVGNSSVYGSSRTIAALAEQRQAPRIFAYIDRAGRPLVAVSLSLAMGFLAFFASSRYQVPAFNWMIALSGLSSILTWGSICLAHLRFRRAWHLQGHTLAELPFRSQPGIVGSWIGLSVNILLLIAQFWTGFAPIGYASMSHSDRVTGFFQAYLAAPVVVAFYVPYKLWFRTPFMRPKTMDLRTGMRELDLSEMIIEENEERARWPRWKKIYKFFC